MPGCGQDNSPKNRASSKRRPYSWMRLARRQKRRNLVPHLLRNAPVTAYFLSVVIHMTKNTMPIGIGSKAAEFRDTFAARRLSRSNEVRPAEALGLL